MKTRTIHLDKNLQAYVIGLSLGDGNLSNHNGRATRLRITCDTKYPQLKNAVINSLKKLLPQNKVGVVNRKNCCDIYCYSNHLEPLLGWQALGGSKHYQKVRIPQWIFSDHSYMKECVRGLIQTDGSIYVDRKYTTVNFVSSIPTLAEDVRNLIIKLGYKANMQILNKVAARTKYTIRLNRRVHEFIKEVNLWKS